MPILKAAEVFIERAIQKTDGKMKEAAGEVGLKETDLKETAWDQLEHMKSSGDGVIAKLQEIRNLTPEQLKERMNAGFEALNRENVDRDEEKELTEDEINERQEAAIKDALERIRNGAQLTTEELGNLGEMMMDQYYISQGYKPLNEHRVTGIDDKKGGFRTGIDGVYEKTNPDGSKSYVIADAKYNTSQLSETNDGKQMSKNWIENRLDDAVGKETADEIRDAAEDDPSSVSHAVYHIEPKADGNGMIHTDIQKVDFGGNKYGEKTIVEYFDADRNRIFPDEIRAAGTGRQ